MFTGLICLGLTFLLPQAFGYLPRPVLTGLLLYLGLARLVEWLWDALFKLQFYNYLLTLAIFILFVCWKWNVLEYIEKAGRA